MRRQAPSSARGHSPAPKDPSPAQFAAFLEQRPAQLKAWDAGEAGLYPFLAWLEAHAVAEQRARVAEHGTHLAALTLTRAHHNVIGICVAWALTHLVGRPSRGEIGEQDRLAVFDLAGRYWTLKDVMAEVRQGVRSFSAEGRRIKTSFTGDALFDITDRLLDLFGEVMKLPEGPPPGIEALRLWATSGEGEVPWERVPLEMRVEYRHLADVSTTEDPSDLPDDLDLGGFTLGQARQVLRELRAQAMHAGGALLAGSTDFGVTLPPRSRSSLIGLLARETRVAAPAVEAVVDLLTADLRVCPDPCLTPLVPLPDLSIVAMSSLIIPSALVRNLTARLQAEPRRFGEAGRLLGLAGSRTVATTLRERLPRAKVAERVNVYDTDGRQLGDLDVLVLDPATSELVVFEVLWGIGPDGSAEVARTEAKAHEKRSQVQGLRSAIMEGARVDWPRGWAVPPPKTFRWFILSSNVLPTLPLNEDGIYVRSHRMLERFRWAGPTVADMVAALLSPPDPPGGLGRREWTTMRFGPYDIRIEYLPPT
jgi:hypothetical protein